MASFREMWKSDWYRLPNLVTEVRLLFCPVPAVLLIAVLFYPELKWWPSLVFTLVVLTDALDGFLARKLNQITELGKYLDPFVDKLLINFTGSAICIIHPYLTTAIVIMFVISMLQNY